MSFLAALSLLTTEGCAWQKAYSLNQPTSGSKLTCIGAPANAKVPAGGDVHGLGQVAHVVIRHAATGFNETAQSGRAAAATRHHGELALLQVHILVYEDHLTHSCVVAGHMRLPDVGQDYSRIVQKSHVLCSQWDRVTMEPGHITCTSLSVRGTLAATGANFSSSALYYSIMSPSEDVKEPVNRKRKTTLKQTETSLWTSLCSVLWNMWVKIIDELRFSLRKIGDAISGV